MSFDTHCFASCALRLQQEVPRQHRSSKPLKFAGLLNHVYYFYQLYLFRRVAYNFQLRANISPRLIRKSWERGWSVYISKQFSRFSSIEQTYTNNYLQIQGTGEWNEERKKPERKKQNAGIFKTRNEKSRNFLVNPGTGKVGIF